MHGAVQKFDADGRPKKNLVDFLITAGYTTFVVAVIPLIVNYGHLELNLISTLLLVATVWVGWVVGFVSTKLSPLIPSLLGQLLIGMLSRNVLLNKVAPANSTTTHSTFLDIDSKMFDSTFSSTSVFIRDLGTAILVMRAGLGFDFDALTRVAKVCINLTLLPVIAEIIICIVWYAVGSAVGFSPLDAGQSIIWGAMMGCVLSAVAPAIIIPCVEDMKARGLVKTKTQTSIMNLIIAASSFDDVIVISTFLLFLAIGLADSSTATSTGALVWTFMKGPVFVIVGVLLGYALAFAFSNTLAKSSTLRVFMALTLPYILQMGSISLDVASGGPVACIIFGLIASRRSSELVHDAAKTLDMLWLLFEPAMFVLIGCEMNFANMDGIRAAWLILLLVILMTVRTVVGYGCAHISGQFSWQQCLFISVAWLPGGTVQAAIGTTALARLMALKTNQSAALFLAKKVVAQDIVTVAVLSILMSAPLGAFLIRFTSASLLPIHKEGVDTTDKEGAKYNAREMEEPE